MSRCEGSFASSLRVVFGLAAICFAGMAACVYAQPNDKSIAASTPGPGAPEGKAVNGKVEILHVQGNVYMISGAGANITVQVGKASGFPGGRRRGGNERSSA